MIKGVRVRAIEVLDDADDVYDVWNKASDVTEGNFIANGIVVHNCIPDYVKQRDDPNGKWRADESPEVLEILKSTAGVLVFQEQLQSLWQNIAGFTAPEAQDARKAVAKKWKDKLKPIEEKWLAGAEKVIGREAAKKYWQRQVTFGRYAFNMSHSVAYCLVAYRCLWLKAYFPHEWWAAVMGYCNPDKLVRYMSVARAEGIEFHGLQLTNLSPRFRAVVVPRRRHDDGDSTGHITPGLLGIKGVGDSAIGSFAVPGEYMSLDDYVQQRGKHKILIERLIKLGAFKGLPGHDNVKATWLYYQYRYCSGSDAAALKREIEAAVLERDGWTAETIAAERERQLAEFRRLYPKRKVIPKKLANWTPKPQVTLARIAELYPDDFTIDEILAFEEQFLGYTIHSPMDQFVTRGGKTIEEAKGHGEVEVMVISVHHTKTKADRPMCRLTVTDGIQTVPLILWEDDLIIQDRSLLKKGVGLRARVCWDQQHANFTLKRACPLIRLKRKDAVGLTIPVDRAS